MASSQHTYVFLNFSPVEAWPGMVEHNMIGLPHRRSFVLKTWGISLRACPPLDPTPSKAPSAVRSAEDSLRLYPWSLGAFEALPFLPTGRPLGALRLNFYEEGGCFTQGSPWNSQNEFMAKELENRA